MKIARGAMDASHGSARRTAPASVAPLRASAVNHKDGHLHSIAPQHNSQPISTRASWAPRVAAQKLAARVAFAHAARRPPLRVPALPHVGHRLALKLTETADAEQQEVGIGADLF